MSYASRFLKRSASFLSAPALALLAVLALVAGLSAQSQDQASKQIPDFNAMKAGELKALSFKAAPAGLPESLPSTLRVSAASLMSAGSDARISTAQGGSINYYLVFLEFDSPASRQRLQVPGVSVLTGV